MPNPFLCTRSSWRGVTRAWILPLLYQSSTQSTPHLTTLTFWAQLPGVLAPGSPMSAAPLPPLGWAVTLRAARSPPAELFPLLTVCCHSEVKEDVSVVNGTVLTTRTASCLPARQLLPLPQEQHIGRACLSLCCPLPAAGTACSARAELPCSCKKPLAFCTPW